MGNTKGLSLFTAIKDGTPYDPTNHLHQKAIETGIGEMLGARIVPTPEAIIRFLMKS